MRTKSLLTLLGAVAGQNSEEIAKDEECMSTDELNIDWYSIDDDATGKVNFKKFESKIPSRVQTKIS